MEFELKNHESNLGHPFNIPYYQDYLSQNFVEYLRKEANPVIGIPGLEQVGHGGGLETEQSMSFLCELYETVKESLSAVLKQRIVDRRFIDQRTRVYHDLNKALGVDFLDSAYETVIGQTDAQGRIVIGPLSEDYCAEGKGRPVAPIPDYLQGPHVTLFGPPDDAKLCINAMNAFHRKLRDEPSVITELLEHSELRAKWGADDEDSKTPLRKDLVSAAENLSQCFQGTLAFTDSATQKVYKLAETRRSLAIKRFPGLALPCTFLFLHGDPIPLHLYDFALHAFAHWDNAEAMTFYVPKLENEEEARYIRHMVEAAEVMLTRLHPTYKMGTIRLLIVLENPRAVFRVHEIMDELYPYFAGASLGWHDYLASTARLFKEESNYRIPVKADPNIVIKYIKASHSLLADVVGPRGGIKIGGMYGVLPIGTDLRSPSFQVTIKGFIKDVVTQLKRDLSGYWVAHPDFVRIGLALVEAWKRHKEGDSSSLEAIITSLLDEKYHKDMLSFVFGSDLVGLDRGHPMYARSLIVADVKESQYIANNHPEEIRYNVFQALQYLADWLAGNGCVALPAQIEGVSVRIMDDLATTERSRWEVWHELYHGRFAMEEFLRIAHEELHFIRKDLSTPLKIVQVKWNERTARWYPLAFKIMLVLMTSRNPPEFATELLLPLTVESVRSAADPWETLQSLDHKKYSLEPYVERFCSYFSICGNTRFATTLASKPVLDLDAGKTIVYGFSVQEIQDAAFFHGDIGENKATLDARASVEQALVQQEVETLRQELRSKGEAYKKHFGIKFLISAQGKTGQELLAALEERMTNPLEMELQHAREALWEISWKRLKDHPCGVFNQTVRAAMEKHGIVGASIAVCDGGDRPYQQLCYGHAVKDTEPVTDCTRFEIASLSKSLAACFALEYFKSHEIPLSTPINALLAQVQSPYRIPDGDAVLLEHLLGHAAINMHYVNGIPLEDPMPRPMDLLHGHETYGYVPVQLLNPPGSKFHYSGGGFIIVEHLLECMEGGRPIAELTHDYFANNVGMKHFTFEQKSLPGAHYATGYHVEGDPVPHGRRMHPAFAAGGLGTALDVGIFLTELTQAYQNVQHRGAITHDTAIRMLYGTDKGSQAFMGANIGLGVFVAEAGPNRLAIHQGANEGFRSLYVHCFHGPDTGKGFVIHSSGELNAVHFISHVAQELLKSFAMEGVHCERFVSDFSTSNIPTEQIVNMGYKELIFRAFDRDLPEAIVAHGPLDPWSHKNLIMGGTVMEVSNQRFARAENLLSPYLPVFDPELFGRQGKVMDSWETARHNLSGVDWMVVELLRPDTVAFALLSTQFHLGNQAPKVKVEGKRAWDDAEWQDIVPETCLRGHDAVLVPTVNDRNQVFRYVKVSMFPDGGFSRLGLFKESPLESDASVTALSFEKTIPKAVKPLAPSYVASTDRTARNWRGHALSDPVDLASAAFGATIVRASNEHYGPAVQVISPYAPISMFDGLESARSRDANHFEDVVVRLARKATVHRIVIDFKYFVNNNPVDLEVQATGDVRDESSAWRSLVPRTWVKPYAGNAIAFDIHPEGVVKALRVVVYPDGGFNRIHVYGTPQEEN